MSLSFYQVRPGDQLYQILQNHYGPASLLRDQAKVVNIVRANNPGILNIDLIYPGQIIMLPDIGTASGPAAAPSAQVVQGCHLISEGLGRKDSDTLGLLNSIDYLKLSQTSADGFVSFVEKTTAAAKSDMRDIALDYYRKEAGSISRSQYNYQRRLNVVRVDMKLGPLHQLINPGKTPGQVLRINPYAAIRPQAILREADQLARIAKRAKIGGVVLQTIDLGHAAFQVHTAPVNSQRTVIVLDTLAGLGGGLAGLGLAVVMLGTPVGWVGFTIMVGLSAAGALGAEKVGQIIQQEVLFDANGNRIETKVDRFWRPFYGAN